MSDGNETPDRLSTPKITRSSMTPTDKNPESEKKSNEIRVPKIPLFTFAKGKNYSKPSTATHNSPNQPTKANQVLHKESQQTNSSPLRKNNYNSFSHSGLEKVSNSKLLSLLRSKTSPGGIESNTSKTLANIDQAPFLPHAEQPTFGLDARPEHTIIPISKTRSNNSFLSGVKNLLNEGQMSNQVPSTDLANAKPFLSEKSLEREATATSTTVVSITKNKTVGKSNMLEGEKKALNIIEKSTCLDTPPTTTGNTSDASQLLEKNETKDLGSATPDTASTKESETSREPSDKNSGMSLKNLGQHGGSNVPLSTSDTKKALKIRYDQTLKKAYPPLKEFVTNRNERELSNEVTVLPFENEHVSSKLEMKKDADLQRMEILKSPHSSSDSTEKSHEAKNTRDESTDDEVTDDEVTDDVTSPNESEGYKSVHIPNYEFTGKEDQENNLTNSKNDEANEIKNKLPETKSIEANIREVTEETVKQVHRVRVSSGEIVFQGSRANTRSDSADDISNFSAPKRARLEDLLNPSKKNKPNEESPSNTSKDTINTSKCRESELMVQRISNTTEIINKSDIGTKDGLHKPLSGTIPSAKIAKQGNDAKNKMQDLSHAKPASINSSPINQMHNNRKGGPPGHTDVEVTKKKPSDVSNGEPVRNGFEKKSLSNLFSKVLKNSFNKNENNPSDGNALHMLRGKTKILENTVPTERLGNKVDDIPLTQPVSGSKPENTDDFQVSLSQPMKKTFVCSAKEEQIKEESFYRGRIDAAISHPGKMELIYVSDSDDTSSENDSLSDTESLASRESNESKVVKDLGSSAEKNQTQTGKWFDPALDWRKSDRELTKNVLWRLADKAIYNKKTISDLIEQGIPRHSYLSGHPLTSVTNDVCSVENYETSNAFFYQQVHKKDRLQYLPLYGAPRLTDLDSTKAENPTNKDTNLEPSPSPTKTSQILAVSSPLGSEATNTPIKQNGALLAKEIITTAHSDTNHNKCKNMKESLSKDSWKQEWLTNLKLVSVSLVDEFPSKPSSKERQRSNEKMQLLKDVFANKFGSNISNTFTESDIIILRGEVEDFPMDSKVRTFYNEMQNNTGMKRARFWSFTKTLRFVANMGFDIYKPRGPASRLATIKPHEVVPQQMIDAKLTPKDKTLRPIKKQASIEQVAALLPPGKKTVVQKNATKTKTPPENDRLKEVLKFEEGEKATVNGKDVLQTTSLISQNQVSFEHSNFGKNATNVNARPVISTENITDNNTTDILNTIDILKTKSQVNIQPGNIHASTERTEYEDGNKEKGIKKSEDLKNNSVSFVNDVLSRTATLLNEKERQLDIANDIIRSLSDEVMRDEIRITSLKGDLNFTKKCLEDIKSQMSEKDVRIRKLMQRIFKKRGR
ncbi:chromatin-silencing protein SIR4 SKDI_04G4410 [Saccharomyces kudriavzevii IFO 1802]|uniref:Sir4 SID domain-containing protein n=1 Tax=Saccharomyces kudriavzevii (strain ATCC MYA-4449 / AS 2.2408 / CBS 8840 / NBRC 1802 / NCYC 2889) TaxID=226230 RepID=A0AA35JDZ6_SACK1|nr:uncharacterized protein SKDI_04G4410 [Saccharomyces kudriavzevii IFO 1802]CAI4058571.1 hypothetical protein SKDI_04G4410 [Saccharomyces kudriavzevii IFO 1802]